ncbi:MAG: glycosyl transferase [Hirschia sp.]|nr:glycosyl transferase [Hirschia sp.]MBF19828.1 glycosyl transferase [Hirschia sp.]
MSAKISIIIPTLNAQDCLPSCLNALTPGLSAGIIREVIVVDGGSSDKTVAAAGLAGCRVISSRPGRGTQLKCGAANAKADWLLFLHADTALSSDWPNAIIQQFDRPETAAAFKLKFDSENRHARWLERRVAQRVKLLGLPYGDQGLFIHRDLYNEIGGYEDVPLMEDVSIVRRIGKKRLDILNVDAITSAAKYERDGWRNRAWRNSFLLTRYLLGADPARLAKVYN